MCCYFGDGHYAAMKTCAGLSGRLVVFGLCCSSLSLSGQINSWTNPVSAPWDSLNWSLGVLPGAGQTILITNAGWKAVGISSATALNNPLTLNIAALTVSSPVNTFNTLLLNYVGLSSPLVIGGGTNAVQLTIASNSAVVMLSSALQVTNAGANTNAAVSLGGTFTESVASRVSAAQLNVGDIGPGVFNLTNSLLQVGVESIFGNANFTQVGGTNSAGVLHMRGGHYVLQS